VVVERTPAAQELIDQALRARGHRVLVTADPVEALRLAERVRVDLAIGDTDLCRSNPGITDELRSLQPEIAILKIAEPGEVHHSEISNGTALGRPFSLDELERAIAKTLAGRS
jgi:DNA-binding response OmpR family regulator